MEERKAQGIESQEAALSHACTQPCCKLHGAMHAAMLQAEGPGQEDLGGGTMRWRGREFSWCLECPWPAAFSNGQEACGRG